MELSHTVFLNSALVEANKYSKRKHAYIANVIPPHIHKEKKELSKCFWLPFSLPDVAKTMLFLCIKSPLSRSSSKQPVNYITLYMLMGLLWFSSEMIKGRRKWVVLGALYNNQ